MSETIGNRIAKYRKKKGMTQEELSNRLGVSSQAVSKWENDASCPDISLLPELCSSLGITADELLSGKQEEVKLVPVEQRKTLDELILHINVNSSDGDRVRVKVPMSLVKVGLELGMNVAGMTSGSDTMKSVDFGKIIDLVEQGVIGKLVEIDSDDGDTVEIVVE